MDDTFNISPELSYEIITNPLLEKVWEQFTIAILKDEGKEFLDNNPDFFQIILHNLNKILKEIERIDGR